MALAIHFRRIDSAQGGSRLCRSRPPGWSDARSGDANYESFEPSSGDSGKLLFLPGATGGRDTVSEREMRLACRKVLWKEQLAGPQTRRQLACSASKLACSASEFRAKQVYDINDVLPEILPLLRRSGARPVAYRSFSLNHE